MPCWVSSTRVRAGTARPGEPAVPTAVARGPSCLCPDSHLYIDVLCNFFAFFTNLRVSRSKNVWFFLLSYFGFIASFFLGENTTMHGTMNNSLRSVNEVMANNFSFVNEIGACILFRGEKVMANNWRGSHLISGEQELVVLFSGIKLFLVIFLVSSWTGGPIS